MKANPQIDELLCSFIDGELAAPSADGGAALVARDAEVARRLRQLQNCKNLVNALPASRAPIDMLEQVKRSLNDGRCWATMRRPPCREPGRGT